ncbi:MAG: competence/damage-inducible protein A, partial [Gammaproteobacteria bacterium]
MPAATAAFLIIGDEILSGRTAEKNLQCLAKLLGERGLRFVESRIVGDDAPLIIDALNALRGGYDYVITSGGIGPTHDDITTDAVSAAFGLDTEENAALLARLSKSCQTRGVPLSNARRRMARAPVGAKMVDGDFDSPPGYRINNVFVCAGVPAIFEMMAQAAVLQMPRAAAIVSCGFHVCAPESSYADILAEVQKQHPHIRIGSYPHSNNNCAIVFSGSDKSQITAASIDAKAKL